MKVLIVVVLLQATLLVWFALSIYKLSDAPTENQTVTKMNSALRWVVQWTDSMWRLEAPSKPLTRYAININGEEGPGVFIADEIEYPIAVSVIGEGDKKEMELTFQGDDLFQGMRTMELLLPEKNGWFALALGLNRAEKLQIPFRPIEFVQVSLNGSTPFLYLATEGWSDEFMIKNGRDPDAQEGRAIPFAGVSAKLSPEDRTKFASSYDLDQLIRLSALMDISGVNVSQSGAELRTVFDADGGKFEPFLWFSPLGSNVSLLDAPGGILNLLHFDPDWRLKVHQFLWEYVNNPDQRSNDFEIAQVLRKAMEHAAFQDVRKGITNRQLSRELDQIIKQVTDNLDLLTSQLSAAQVTVLQRPNLNVPSYGKSVLLTLDFTVQSPVALRLQEIDITEKPKIKLYRDDGSGEFDDADTEVEITKDIARGTGGLVPYVIEPDKYLWPGTAGDPHVRHRFFVVRTSGNGTIDVAHLPLKTRVASAVTNKPAAITQKVTWEEAMKSIDEATVDRDAFLKKHRYFKKDGEKNIRFVGVGRFDENLIIPEGLEVHIAKGSILWMGSGASIVSYSPVITEGTERYPVKIVRADWNGPWGSFIVFNAQGHSRIRNTEFSGGGESRGLHINPNAMVAFHNSPVTITGSLFTDAVTTTALSLREAYIDVNNTHIENNGEGMRVEFVPAGSISNTSILDHRNDGMKVSWSPIAIENTEVFKGGGTCLRVSERAAPLLSNVSLKRCKVGLGVYDDAHVKADHLTLEDNEVGIEARNISPVFSAPSVAVIKALFLENSTNFQADEESIISIEQ